MFKRNLSKILEKSKKSCLLLGPRQAGKSTLMQSLGPDLTINLMHDPTFVQFSRNPSELEERLGPRNSGTVLIDEIQRLPSLLNTLQVLIDGPYRGVRFLLTGSSARKFRRGSANLLPGRLHTYYLGALASSEVSGGLDSRRALAYGTLPGIYSELDDQDRAKTLRSYASTYLREEVQAEALTKNIEGFSRFLFLAAATSGQFLDLNKLSSEAAVPRQTASRFFEILEDTLIVARVPAFAKSERKRLVQHPRYFFFDTGVLGGLLDNFNVSTDRIGQYFENLVFNQLQCTAWSYDEPIRISSYRTAAGAEVDFIVEVRGRVWAIEVKASINIGPDDLSGLKSFTDFYAKPCKQAVAYLGTTRRQLGKVEVWPWQDLLAHMFAC